MDIDEIRRTNIRAIERELGSPTAVAEAVGMSYAQYQNLRDGAKDPRSGKKRGMRKETAWRFEDAGKKPRGWLDQVHTEHAAQEGLLDIAKRYEQSTDKVKSAIDELTSLPPEEADKLATILESIRATYATKN